MIWVYMIKIQRYKEQMYIQIVIGIKQIMVSLRSNSIYPTTN